jgi:hypothetical protein
VVSSSGQVHRGWAEVAASATGRVGSVLGGSRGGTMSSGGRRGFGRDGGSVELSLAGLELRVPLLHQCNVLVPIFGDILGA